MYTASHDLKQPVNNMAGLFEELKRTTTFPRPRPRPMVGMFDGALQQMLSTIDGLTRVVQLQRQLEHVPAEDMELKTFTKKLSAACTQAAPSRRRHFSLDFAPCPACAWCGPALQSMLYNLLSNALKYAEPGRPPHCREHRRWPGRHCSRAGQRPWHRPGPPRGELFQLFRRFHPEVAGSGWASTSSTASCTRPAAGWKSTAR